PGFLRFAIPMFPSAAGYFSFPMMILAVVGIVYGALMAYAQTDVKRLVAYSSVSHLGFVMLGMFAFNEDGISGSILQMINHGISTGALFLIVGMIYERRHTRLIGEFGGLANNMKVFAAIFVIITLSSIGLPGTNGFVGEFLILAGAFREALSSAGADRIYLIALGVFAASGIILGAVYMLTMLRRVIFGKISNPKNEGLKDLNTREFFVLIPLVVLVFLIGILPNIFLKKMEGSVKHTISLYKETVSRARTQRTGAGISDLLKASGEKTSEVNE
ncbi:MAG: NADH-quinone oxidoreductase subunit M, partial [Deltaproteobacteria bacterium]|nr:NADH-quinone oxidoreductase subunit M [Deltaproteobacteria bacterium]